jgi:ribosomal protein S12 methylthiotransferase
VITSDPAEADTIVVNTCSFIESAVNESIDTILDLAKFKKSGVCRRLIVAGCLPQRYREETMKALPEVDQFIGTGAFDKIVEAVESLETKSKCLLPDPDLSVFQELSDQDTHTVSHTAYVKVAEGCSKHCTYCIIPKLRGRHRSRPFDNIVSQAGRLILSNVREIVLVAQDTTFYGKDLNPTVDFGQLLGAIADISDNVWLRWLYGHPQSVDEQMIKMVASRENICSYFDIPIQHACTRVLKKMGRGYTRDDLCRLFDKIRELIPGAALRTTAIVGFPGETDKDFKMLYDFIHDVGFDHLGVFRYSDAEDLPSHRLSNPVPDIVATQRYEQLMLSQAKLSLANNQKHIGKIYQVLVEADTEDHRFVGRTAFKPRKWTALLILKATTWKLAILYMSGLQMHLNMI